MAYNGFPWLNCTKCSSLVMPPTVLGLDSRVEGEIKCRDCGTPLRVISVLYIGDPARVETLDRDVRTAGGSFEQQ